MLSPYSLMVERSNGNAEIQVQFLLRAPNCKFLKKNVGVI